MAKCFAHEQISYKIVFTAHILNTAVEFIETDFSLKHICMVWPTFFSSGWWFV